MIAAAHDAPPAARHEMLSAMLALAELGYPSFPCVPNDKKPATMHGCRDASTDAEQIEKWCGMWPGHNVAIATDGLVVVDFDTVDGKQNPWWAEHAGAFDSFPQQITPRGGRHIFSQRPNDRSIRNSAGGIAPGVDIRTDGGYVLTSPSAIDGKPYAWVPGLELDCKPSELPLLPRWLLDQLTVQKSERLVDAGTSSEIPQGSRNATLASIGGSLRRMGMSHAAIAAALLTTNSERCRPPLDDAEVEKIAWSVSRYEPDQTSVAVAENWHSQDSADDDEAEIETPDPGALPVEFADVPGLLGDVIKWNLDTAIKPQPTMALANALALMGTVTGRKVADAMGTRTNLYAICLADSGAGKEHARRVSKEILQRANMLDRIGSEEIKSSAGLVAEVRKQSEILFQIDEIGRWLQTLQNPGVNPHAFEIISALLKMFTSSNSLYVAGGYADISRRCPIDQPHVCLYGTTVEKSFFESLTTESLSDGFMGRLLVFEASNRRKKSGAMPGDFIPPQSILETVMWWRDYRPAGLFGDVIPRPRVLSDTIDATAAFSSVEEYAEGCPEGTTQAALWVRAHEKSRKLALLYAVSEDREAVQITGDAAEWGCGVVRHLTKRMEWLADRHIADGPFGRASQRVYRIIESAGADGITGAKLCRATRNIKPRERAEIIDALRMEGRLDSALSSNSGRKTATYRAARFSNAGN